MSSDTWIHLEIAKIMEKVQFESCVTWAAFRQALAPCTYLNVTEYELNMRTQMSKCLYLLSTQYNRSRQMVALMHYCAQNWISSIIRKRCFWITNCFAESSARPVRTLTTMERAKLCIIITVINISDVYPWINVVRIKLHCCIMTYLLQIMPSLLLFQNKSIKHLKEFEPDENTKTVPGRADTLWTGSVQRVSSACIKQINKILMTLSLFACVCTFKSNYSALWQITTFKKQMSACVCSWQLNASDTLGNNTLRVCMCVCVCPSIPSNRKSPVCLTSGLIPQHHALWLGSDP